MSKETVIECRQLSSKQVFSNGDFETVIENNNLFIGEGDTLSLKKAVIDSVQTQSEELYIEEEIDCILSFYQYFVNWKGNGAVSSKTQQYYTYDKPDVAPNNEMFFGAIMQDGLNGNVNRQSLDLIIFNVNPLLNSGTWGNCTVTYRYQASHQTGDEFSHYTVQIPLLSCHSNRTYQVAPGIIFKGDGNDDSLSMTTSHNYLKANGLLPTPQLQTSTDDVTKRITLKQKNVSLKIKAGRYSCDEICQIINSQVNLSVKNNVNLTGGALNNSPLLTNTGEFNVAADTTAGGVNTKHILLSTGNVDGVPDDANPSVNSLQWLATGDDIYNQYVGTSDFSIAYDGEKFKFEQISSPYYTNKGTVASNRGLTGILYNNKGVKGDATSNIRNVINKSSGIVFSGLEPAEFWYDMLGFDGSICPDITNGNVEYATAQVKTTLFLNTLQDGTHLTCTAPTLDSSIIKGQEESPDGHNPTFNCITPSFGFVEVQASGQIEIYAKNAYNYSILKTYGGYMLLEVRLGLVQDYTGEQAHLKNVFGIITNYYRSNNYVVASTEDGVLYEHVGNSVQINTIRIRILNPNTLEPVPGLDQDNSIFLSLIKPPPQPAPPPKKK